MSAAAVVSRATPPLARRPEILLDSRIPDHHERKGAIEEALCLGLSRGSAAAAPWRALIEPTAAGWWIRVTRAPDGLTRSLLLEEPNEAVVRVWAEHLSTADDRR